MPFCVAGVPLLPVFHLGAAIGEYVPFWDQHDEFGATNLLVVKPEEGRSLARALGRHSAVLMDRHGATVVGGGIRELVSRSIFMCQNADYQLHARALGSANVLHEGEVKLAGTISMMPNVVTRTWEFWSMRLTMSGRMLAGAKSPRATKRARAAVRRARPARKASKRR
jgi:HCOMODA/2-hydroxy-3-carboxy-muconic semialdehyde decarboxylase